MPGLRPILLLALACVLAAAPLMAIGRQVPSSEARAALGTLKDRLRVLYIQNGNKLDANWRLEDLVTPAELDGKYYDHTSYGFFVRSVESRTATIYALATNGPQVVCEITDIAIGEATMTSPGSLPDNPPGHSKGELERHAQMAHEMRVRAFQRDLPGIIPGFAPWLAAGILFVLALLARRSGRSLSSIRFLAFLAALCSFFWLAAIPIDYEINTFSPGTMGHVGLAGIVACTLLGIFCPASPHVPLQNQKQREREAEKIGGGAAIAVASGILFLVIIVLCLLTKVALGPRW